MMNTKGFTLLELMVVVIIIAIVAAFAYPTYRQHVVKTRRADAKGSLAELAQLQEDFYVNNPSRQYATSFAQLNIGGAFELKDDDTLISREGYYEITFSPTATADFTLTATPTSKGGQDQDNDCLQFTIDSLGQKEPAQCW